MARIRQLIKQRIFYSALYFLYYVPFIALGIYFSIIGTLYFLIFVAILLVIMYFSLGKSYIDLIKALMPIYRTSKYNHDKMLVLIQSELEDYKSMSNNGPLYTNLLTPIMNSKTRGIYFSNMASIDRDKLLALYLKLEEIALRNKPTTEETYL